MKNILKASTIKNNKLLYFIVLPLLILSFISITFSIFFSIGNHMDSDIASEVLLGKEMLVEHKIFPTGWFYSTELRILNIQLLIAPLIKFTGNMLLSKSIANFILLILFCSTYYYLMKSLEINKTYSLLILVVIISPISNGLMYDLYSGAFYTSYLIFIMLNIVLWNSINNKCIEKKKKIILYIISIILSFSLGIQGTRLLANLYIPLLIMDLILIWLDIKDNKNMKFNYKTIFNRVFMSSSMFICSFLGLAFSRKILSKTFHYTDLGVQTFVNVNEIGNRFFLSISSILTLFGTVANGKVISINGIISAINLIFVILLFVVSYKLLKSHKYLSNPRKALVIFFWVSFLMNTYFLIFTNILITDRYYVDSMVLLFPILGIYFDEFKNKFLPIEKFTLAFFVSICILCSQYNVIYKGFIKTDNSQDKYNVINFLKKNNLNFGYATFWNANVLNVLSNGKVEIANINGSLNGSYLWLTPARYYKTEFHHGKTFLLLNKDEVKRADPKLLSKGKKITKINNYVIYIYDKNIFNFK